MKFFIAFFALAAVAVASPLHNPVATFEAELAAIIAAIHHPSTDPATAALLQEQLETIMAQLTPEVDFEPINVGPAIIDEAPTDIVIPEPVVPTPVTPANKPKVQIIINVIGGANTADIVVPTPVVPGPVVPEIEPTPVIVVDQPQVPVEPVIVAPIIVPEVEPTPVIVVDQPQVPVEPVVVAPIIVPEPVVVLPDILN